MIAASAAKLNLPVLRDGRVGPGLREQLLSQQPACEALNKTALNLATLRPCIPRENILLIEAIHDLFVNRDSVEALGEAWGQPDIWRLPHGHASKSLSPTLAGRILRWLAPRMRAVHSTLKP